MTVRVAAPFTGKSLPYTVTRMPMTIVEMKHPTAPDINKGRLPTLSTRMTVGRVASILEEFKRHINDRAR